MRLSDLQRIVFCGVIFLALLASVAATDVSAQAVSITTASPLPTGVVGVAYSQGLSATGGTGNYTWSVVSGLPAAGLALSSAGVISGTPNTAGPLSFTVQVADDAMPPVTDQKVFSLTIESVLSITTTSLPNGVQGTAYSQTVTATGGSGSNTWSLLSGTLPASLALSSAGVISGTPTGSGLSSFTVQVTDGVQTKTQALTITVDAVLTITTATPMPSGAPGVLYSQTLTATGGTGSNTWSLASGSLPTGLSLSAGGVISGTPSGSGTTFTAQVTDGVQTVTKSLTINISAALTITTATPMPTGAPGVPYSQTLTATGGTGSNTWSLASGSLPTGLSLSAAGVISGTPSGSGTTFTAQVTDGVQTATKSLTINLSAALTITTATPMPSGAPGVPYSQTLTATGGTGSNTWSLASGSLPTGLSLSAAGVISGTPSGSGTTFTAQVTDGVQTTTKSLTINISAALTITTATPMPSGAPGVPYSQTLTATGGTGSNTWSLASGSLPTGLSLSAAGVISGTPSGSGTTFTAQVTDGVQTTTKSLTINISAALTITTATPMPSGAPGVPYSQTLTATGGTGSNTWSLASGSLPTGLSLSAAGVISGTPSGSGTTFTAQVTDGVQTTTKSLTINISAALTITTATPMPNGAPGVPYSQTLTATGGTGSNTWSLASGSLPTGLSLSAGGVISGTPSGSGTTFTAQVTDGVQTATKSLTINVSAALTITTATPMPTGVAGTPYSQTLTATGGTGSNTWSLASGSLPTGLSLSAGGVISGTPSGSGTTFTAQVTDGVQTATKSLTINISAALTITTATPMPSGAPGVPYSQTLTATGGTGSNTWSLASGSLPTGLSLSAAGVISGTPSGSGTTFTAQVTDGVQTATKSLTINISAALTITTATPMPTGVAGTPYSQTLTATGGTGSNTWSLASGSLPTGLSLSAAGVISGTPSGSGTTFTAQVTDGVQTATKSLTIPVNAVLTITSATLPNGIQGSGYSHTLTATGGTGSYTWSLASGSLPTGLSLSGAGVISGTTSGTGVSTFTAQVTDGIQTTTKSLSITVNAVLTITTVTLPNGVQGTAYSQTLTATGGTGSNTWSLASGSLPAGLSLSAAGIISGTPTAAGSTFTVQVADGVQTTTKSLTITVNTVLTITSAALPNGVEGSGYSHTLTATGGTGSNTWSLASGTLPTGLSLSAAGVISGTTSGTGVSTFTAQVTDGIQTATKSLSITVHAVLAITTATLPNGVQGTAYSQTLTATGGTGSNTWSLASGTLPTGLSLSAAGVISGTTSGTGVSTFTVQVTDGIQTKQQALTITVNVVLAITTTSLPNGVLTIAYSQTLTATGGTGSNTWSLASGTLPGGLALSAAGVISGTPTGTGASPFTVQVTDGVQTKQQALTITVNAVLTITTASLPNGAPGVAYSQTLAATGGTGSNTWSLASGSLPTGLSLSAAGLISGTPSGSGTTFTVQVTDGVQTKQKSLTLTISTVLAISTASLPNGVQSTAYSPQTLTATGGTGSYTWSLASGTLPTGLSLSAAGVINGTPTGTGASTFTVQVTDGVQTVTNSLTITVDAVLTITTTTLPNGDPGVAYSQTLAATGGTGTNTWSLSTGTLPTGLTLSAAGVISGTPSGSGTTFTVQVTDGTQTTTKLLTITVNAVLTITTASLQNGVVGIAYSLPLTATGGTGSNTWTLASGTLPTGLALSAAGVISGTPSGTPGASPFTVQVTDGAQTVQKALSITVNAVLAINQTSLPNAVQGTAYSQTLTTTGGTGTNTWLLATGSLPTGLTLSAAGVISGTPTATGSTFTVQVADGVQTTQQSLTITVNTVLTITTTTLPTGVQGIAYSQTLSATGGTGTNTWSLATGSLPTGLTLSAAGVISGTPTATGSTFTVQVTDGIQTKQQSLTLNVVLPLTITTASLPTGGVGAAYFVTLAATGGTSAPYTWTIETGTLPAGLSLNPATGVINGTPTSSTAGPITLAIKAADNNVIGLSVTKSLALTVVTAIAVTTASPLPQGAPTILYSQQLVATGGTGTYTWTLASGTLPNGLTLGTSGVTAGLISGTPTAAGSSNFMVQATDTTVAGLIRQQSFTLVIVAGITITNPTALGNGVPGAAYSENMLATGGTGVYTWSIASGTLPTGLALSAAGVISGMPTTVGTSNVTLRAADSVIPTLNTTKAFTLAIVNSLTVTTSASLPGGVRTTAYSQTMAAAGGTAPFTWSIVSGNLPAGVTLNAAGTLSGTPTASGTFTVTVRATDSGGPPQTATKLLSLIIVDPLAISTGSPLPTGVKDAAYSQILTATGGTAPYTWSIASGSLPQVLILNSSGSIGGLPTTVGSSNFTISVTDNSVPPLTVQKAFTLDVVGALTITTSAPFPSSFVGFAYSLPITASGGKTPYAWSVTSGTLPTGLTLNPTTGVLSGTVTTAGISNFTIRVTDSDSPAKTAQQATTLAVLTPPGSGSGPTISLNGVQIKIDPGQQMPISVKLSSPYAAAIQGSVTLTVTPAAGMPAEAYSAVQYSTGGKTVNFTVPANATDAVFPAATSTLLLVTGTVTGGISFTGSIQSGPQNIALTSTTVDSTPPKITNVIAERIPAGLRIQVFGYSPERKITEVQFSFDVRFNGAVQKIDLIRVVDSDFATWYQNPASSPYGSTFKFEQLFNVGGSTAAIEAVTITLKNTLGNTVSQSTPLTGN